MHPPSRARRILKWTGVGLSLLILAGWALSLWCRVQHWTTSRTMTSIDRGWFVLERSDLDMRDLYSLAHLQTTFYWLNVGLEALRFQPPIRFDQRPINSPSNPHATDRNTTIFVALWVPLLAAAIPTAWLWHRDRHRVRPGCCLRCGYDLTGNTSGVCSECGLPKPPPATL